MTRRLFSLQHNRSVQFYTRVNLKYPKTELPSLLRKAYIQGVHKYKPALTFARVQINELPGQFTWEEKIQDDS